MAYLDDRLFSHSWSPVWSDWHNLYRLDDHYPDSPTTPSLPESDEPLSFSPPPDVKQEPDDPGCFIIELSPPQPNSSLVPHSLAPPTEVPLRATQASSDMRRMMTVFRLNPFAIHNGVGAVPAQLESAHPLDAEPITFEFQLDIEPGILDPESRPSDSLPNLRPFSPDFDLHEKPSDPWPAYHDVQELPTPPIQSWDIAYLDAEDPFYTQPVSPRRSSRIHPPVSPPYIQHQQKAATLPGDSTYTNSSSYNNRITPQPEPIQWGHQSSLRDVGYHPCSAAASRSPPNAYADSTISSLRRWSLPDPHVQPAPAPFLV